MNGQPIKSFEYCSICKIKRNQERMIRRQRATTQIKSRDYGGFPGGAVVENLSANAGDTGSSPGLGRSHMPRSN